MISKMFPKGKNELRTTIGNDCFWKTMYTNNVMKKEFNSVSGGNDGSTRNEMSELSEMIVYDKDAIKLVGKR
jgi:hypothetical protein